MDTTSHCSRIRPLALSLALFSFGPLVTAQTLGADFSADYSFTSLGSVPALPASYGGLTFLDNNTLLIGGAANSAGGLTYSIGVLRDINTQQVTGFSGTATAYMGGTIGAYNDGGLVFGPGGVLFSARWPVNQLGQTKPGSTAEDKIIDTAVLGVAGSLSALNFVPTGFGGEGLIKLVSYGGGQWYSASLTPDGNGTFDLTGLVQVDLDPVAPGIQNVPGGPEGFTYIAAGNPGFGNNSLLLSEFQGGVIAAYELDALGNPLVTTRRTFLSGLTGAEGAAIDPVTGDFLFSTFGGNNQVVLVSGFTNPVPEPSSALLMLAGGLGLAAWLRRRTAASSA
jgi:hypothetical protein